MNVEQGCNLEYPCQPLNLYHYTSSSLVWHPISLTNGSEHFPHRSPPDLSVEMMPRPADTSWQAHLRMASTYALCRPAAPLTTPTRLAYSPIISMRRKVLG